MHPTLVECSRRGRRFPGRLPGAATSVGPAGEPRNSVGQCEPRERQQRQCEPRQFQKAQRERRQFKTAANVNRGNGQNGHVNAGNVTVNRNVNVKRWWLRRRLLRGGGGGVDAGVAAGAIAPPPTPPRQRCLCQYGSYPAPAEQYPSCPYPKLPELRDLSAPHEGHLEPSRVVKRAGKWRMAGLACSRPGRIAFGETC